ncbi:nuclear transport factor 2 family protein [Limnobacter parvus]|uniref:Tetratricopeptide repeat protein n=1 Tax=Limnobacter parvus TaxID=2939690 RepID=A0ABT1XHK7_9BURK|nr:tetratricopeptide repeat protein [Limnobacter parvus]MCR2746654.1 tetratricopeptide repeat protein [Limnobacter parvus]
MQDKKTITSSISGKFQKSKYALLFALAGLAFAGAPSHADEADEVSKLIQRSQFEQAQARADAYLANRPNDAQMRFLKGLILTERNKTGEAITVFTKLTEDFPELPEPYNNLAVLYAGRGEYEKARESLEMAIRTHPSYATAHENLGDVYAKLASQSYDKALQLDGRNSTAQTKLSLVRNLIAGKPEAIAVAAVVPAPVTPAPTPKPAPVETKPAAVEPKPAPAVTPPPPVVVAPPVVAVAPSKPAPTPAQPAITASQPAESKTNTIGMDRDVLAAVEAWAKAWTDQNMAGYLGAYSKDFDTPGKMSRANWEKMREQRIVGKETIRVVVENPLITITGNQAVVKFKQSYFSNRLNNVSTKTLTMKQENGTWKITTEQVGG